jgi:hypothetical protein
VYPHASSARTENIHVRHYQIHIEGCTHETYAVVPPEKSNTYKSILCATKIIDDFPRNKSEEHRKAMLCLKPAFFSTEPESSLSWISDDPLSSLVNIQANPDEVPKAKDEPLVIMDTASSSANPHPQVRNHHL